jgi:hypothetical protein
MAPHWVSLADAEPVSLPAVMTDHLKTDAGTAMHRRVLEGDR